MTLRGEGFVQTVRVPSHGGKLNSQLSFFSILGGVGWKRQNTVIWWGRGAKIAKQAYEICFNSLRFWGSHYAHFFKLPVWKKFNSNVAAN